VIAISGCACTSTENVRGKVVELFTVLVGNDGASSGSGICAKDDTSLYSTKTNFRSTALANEAQGVLTLKTTPQIVVPVLV